MSTSNNSNGIDTNYKIIIPSKVRKRDGVNVETNTEPWLSTCQSCMEKENQCHNAVGDNVDMNEYAKAINYINTIHNFINESMLAKQNERKSSGVSLNSSFSMPDLPNFLTIFANISGLSKLEKSQMAAKSTSTTTLLPLCAALKRYTEQEENLMIEFQNNDNLNIEKHSETSETSLSRYRLHTAPKYLCDSKIPINVDTSQNRLKLNDQDSACSCSTRSSEKHSAKKINIKAAVSKASAKVDTRWTGSEKRYEYLFNRKFGKKTEKMESSKDNGLSEAEIDLYATQLLNETVGDYNNCLNKSQESRSPKSENSNKQKLKIARMPLERKKLVQKARDESPLKSREKPSTAIPVKKRTNDKDKCKLKACNSENCNKIRDPSNNWSMAQEKAQDAIDFQDYTTLECSLLDDEHQMLKFGGDHPIMSFQLPSLTDIQMYSDSNREHKNGNNKKSITSLPNHIAVALPHAQEKSGSLFTKKSTLHPNSYIQSRLEAKSSDSMILDDQELENCTDSDICDDVTDIAENTMKLKTSDSTRSRTTSENCASEPFRQIRTFKDSAEIAKFKHFVSNQCKKCLKYSNSISNDTISSDINSSPDLDHDIMIRKVKS